MALVPSAIGENPQQPGVTAEVFIPDQLIAGRLPLITESVMLTGAAPLRRGTLLGKTSFGSVSASSGTSFAAGSVTIAQLPTNGDTVTVGGTVVTFVADPQFVLPNGNQVVIGPDVATTAASLMALLEGSTDANLIKFNYALNGAEIALTAAVAGIAGNALTLATSDAPAVTLSGATLAGGVANTGNATVGTLAAGAKMKYGNYTAVCDTATTAKVYDPAGDYLGEATFGVQFTDAQISFKITAGGTACVAGDTFVLAAAPATPDLYKLCTTGATDGSQNPCAILVDYSDPSQGNVTTGVYLTGEFNEFAVILDPSISLAAARSALRPLGIFIKRSVPATSPSNDTN